MVRVECQSAAERESAGPPTRIHVAAGTCTVAASPAPARETRPPRPTRRKSVSPLKSVTASGPDERSWPTGCTCPLLTPA
eukprot:3940905-Alexandrium_andersonii.AAC.1